MIDLPKHQAKHTPGPWQIGRKLSASWIITGYGKDVATVTMNKYTENGANEANARLIAAAPELLAALKAIASSSIGIEEKNGALRAWGDCCHIAQAAIAKAEGR